MIFKELETTRLLLKNISKEDRVFILSQFSDNDINQFLFDAEPMKDVSEADELIEFYTCPEPRGQHRWILVRKSDEKAMGTCGFHCLDMEHNKIDIGYDLKKEYQGSGYMQEALDAIINFAVKELKISQIDAHIYHENQKSIAAVKKYGFEFYGKTEECQFRDQNYLHHIYTLKA